MEQQKEILLEDLQGYNISSMDSLVVIMYFQDCFFLNSPSALLEFSLCSAITTNIDLLRKGLIQM